MSLSPHITYDDPKKLPPLLRLSEGVQRPDVRKVMGRAVAGVIRKNFTKLDRERKNKMGGDRTHFYADARRAVQQPELTAGDGVKVAINKLGIALRYFGGDIVPGQNGSGRKWLTIPARKETYGHRAREFTDLHFVLFRSNLAALVQNEQSSLGGHVSGSVTPKGRNRGDTTGGGIFYWLVKHAHFDEDPAVLPPEETEGGNEGTLTAALGAGEDFIRTLIARAARN